jgi:hypothetical protein
MAESTPDAERIARADALAEELYRRIVAPIQAERNALRARVAALEEAVDFPDHLEASLRACAAHLCAEITPGLRVEMQEMIAGWVADLDCLAEKVYALRTALTNHAAEAPPTTKEETHHDP